MYIFQLVFVQIGYNFSFSIFCGSYCKSCYQAFSLFCPSDLVFDTGWPRFRFGLNFIEIHILGKYNKEWTKTVATRELTNIVNDRVIDRWKDNHTILITQTKHKGELTTTNEHHKCMSMLTCQVNINAWVHSPTYYTTLTGCGICILQSTILVNLK